MFRLPCYFILPNAPIFFQHRLSVSRTSFSHTFRISLLLANYLPFLFLHLRMLGSLHPCYLCWVQDLGNRSLLSASKYILQLPSDSAFWRVICNSNVFFSGCFLDFCVCMFSIFRSLIMMHCGSGELPYSDFTWLCEHTGLYLLLCLEVFSPVLFLLSFQNSDRTDVTSPLVPRSLRHWTSFSYCSDHVISIIFSSMSLISFLCPLLYAAESIHWAFYVHYCIFYNISIGSSLYLLFLSLNFLLRLFFSLFHKFMIPPSSIFITTALKSLIPTALSLWYWHLLIALF